MTWILPAPNPVCDSKNEHGNKIHQSRLKRTNCGSSAGTALKGFHDFWHDHSIGIEYPICDHGNDKYNGAHNPTVTPIRGCPHAGCLFHIMYSIYLCRLQFLKGTGNEIVENHYALNTWMHCLQKSEVNSFTVSVDHSFSFVSHVLAWSMNSFVLQFFKQLSMIVG